MRFGKFRTGLAGRRFERRNLERPLLQFDQGTFARDSEASYKNLDGSIAWAEANEFRWVRIEAYSSNGSGDAGLFEGERENLLTYSEDLSQWADFNSPLSSSGFLAPDGESDAWELEDTDAGANGKSLTFNVDELVDFAMSVFIKKNEENEHLATVSSADAASAGHRIGINTATGEVSAFKDQWTSRIETEDWGDYWRFSIAGTPTATGSCELRLFPARTSDDLPTSGSNVFWGVQVEKASFPSSYIRTNGAAATREADNLNIPEASIPQQVRNGNWYITLYSEGASDDEETNDEIVWAYGESTNEWIRFDNPQDTFIIRDDDGNVLQTPAVAWNRWQGVRLELESQAGALTIKGAESGNGTTKDTPWNFTESPLQIGNRSTVTVNNAYFGLITEPKPA